MAVETSNGDNRRQTNGSSDADQTPREAVGSSEIEQYGVWVKAGPVDVSDDEENATQFMMEDLETESAESTLTKEEEALLGSLETQEDKASEVLSPEETSDEGLAEEEFALEDFDLSSEGPSTHHEEQLNLDQVEGEPFDDVGGDELNLPDSSEKEVSMDIPEESAPILQKIEKDLLSIKEELTALKNEIYSLRSGTTVEPEEQREEAESGFFEEDEDETIALTGDELDNILNTADITEQTGQSTASPDENDLMLEEEVSQEQPLIDREDVIGEEEEQQISEVAVEETVVEEESIEDSLADLASLSEEPLEELTTEEEAPSEEEDLLDLPEEEEIVLEEVPEEAGLQTEAAAEEAPEIELDLSEEGGGEEPTFELDEELDLSPSEKEDLEASQDLLGEEELADLSEPEEPDEAELVEMEAEATEAAPSETLSESEQPIEEGFNLTDEELELPEVELEELEEPSEPSVEAPYEPATAGAEGDGSFPEDLKSEIRVILKYMDQLLESLPEEKIEEFANSEYFDVYKRLFEELGLTT